jgi:hypothetical protein
MEAVDLRVQLALLLPRQSELCRRSIAAVLFCLELDRGDSFVAVQFCEQITKLPKQSKRVCND